MLKDIDTTLNQFSAGFYENECCFVIQNLPIKKKDITIPISVSIAEKMILRGLPTKPSSYLIKELDNYFSGETFSNSKFLSLIGENDPSWKVRIKGDPDNPSNNPAKLFYDELIPKYFKEYPFIKQLIIPECPSNWIITNSLPEENIPNIQYYDFFIDAFDLVIEIDGLSHKRHGKKISDADRDKILSRRGIKCIRMKTEDIRRENDEFISKINTIKDHINTYNIHDIEGNYLNKEFSKEKYEFIATGVIRFQILLIELIKSGSLSLSDKVWNLDIQTDIKASFNWAEIACKDLFEWILSVSEIYNEGIKTPNLNINLSETNNNNFKSTKAFNIDFKLFERWDEEVSRDKIYIRSDFINKERYLKSNSEGIIAGIKDHGELKFFGDTTPKLQSGLPLEHGLQKFNKQLFGFDKFKDGQLEIISNIVNSDKTLGLLPTGGGKSLCYHLSASLFQGCCIVICPIIALMKDQVAELQSMGFNIRAAEISSQQDKGETEQVLEKITKRKLQFVFVSPERFQKKDFRDKLTALRANNLIGSIVVDEVHCLSEWGHDFRISYLNLSSTLKKILPNVPVICLTATASLRVLHDIQREFDLPRHDIIYKMHNSREELGFQVLNPSQRDELSFKVLDLVKKVNERKIEEVLQKAKKSKRKITAKRLEEIKNKKHIDIDKLTALVVLLEKLQKEKGWVSSEAAGIIFTPWRNSTLGCNTVRNDLKIILPELKTGLFAGKEPYNFVADRASPVGKNFEERYRGHLFDKYKEIYQKEFKKNELDLMCCTKAFGMGVNKPNIRFTVHYSMPSSLEALYQEGGRAGRDGNPAECYVLFSKEKENIPDEIHDANYPPEKLIEFADKGFKRDFKTQLWLTVGEQPRLMDDLFFCNEVLKSIDKRGYGYLEVIKNKLNLLVKLKAQFPGREDLQNKKTSPKINVEKYIFRLCQLGIVKDWTVDDFINQSYRVETVRLTDDEVVDNLLNYIARFVSNKTKFQEEKDELSNLSEKYKGLELKKHLLWFLLKWNYGKFVYNRRQSLKNLYEACMGFDVKNPRKFKDTLDYYFRIDELTEDLAGLSELKSPKEMVSFLKENLAPKGKILQQTKIEKIKFSLARYLESYQDDPGFDLVSGMCRLLNDEFDNSDGAPRLVNFIKVSQKDIVYWNDAFEDLLGFVSNLEPKYREQFSAEVCPHLENKKDIVKVNDYLDDDYSAISYLKELNKELEKVF